MSAAQREAGVEPSQNEAWGFFGTIGHDSDAAKAWPIAFRAIAAATKCDPWEVRAFLDSRYGRHFADEVSGRLTTSHNIKQAIAGATDQWMAWRITRGDIAEIGEGARGLPYLTAYVVYAGFADEATAPAE